MIAGEHQIAEHHLIRNCTEQSLFFSVKFCFGRPISLTQNAFFLALSRSDRFDIKIPFFSPKICANAVGPSAIDMKLRFWFVTQHSSDDGLSLTSSDILSTTVAIRTSVVAHRQHWSSLFETLLWTPTIFPEATDHPIFAPPQELIRLLPSAVKRGGP